MKRMFIAITCLCLLALSGVSYAGTYTYDGQYLRVGISNSGGLIDDGFVVGIDYDKTGTSTWTGFDFLKPGTPFEFYSIGVNGAWQAAGYDSGNNFGATTTDTSAGSVFSAMTTFAYGDLTGVQTMSFASGAGTISFNVVLTNSGSTALDVVYARGLDPDQDVYAGGGYPTTNTIVNPDLVTGSAPITDWTIGIFSNSSFAHVPGVSAPWSQDPYNLLTGPNDGFGDYTINMAWDLGTLAPGAQAAFGFEYRIAETQGGVVNPGAVPEPGTMLLMGTALAGLFGARRRLSRKV